MYIYIHSARVKYAIVIYPFIYLFIICKHITIAGNCRRITNNYIIQYFEQ